MRLLREAGWVILIAIGLLILAVTEIEGCWGGRAYADVVLKQGTTVLGPVNDVSCGSGATCTRVGSVGTITAASQLDGGASSCAGKNYSGLFCSYGGYQTLDAGISITVPSSQYAFRATTSGSRIDVGGGLLDYFSSDGTTISTPARMYIGDAGSTFESLATYGALMVHGPAVGTAGDTGLSLQYLLGKGYLASVSWGTAYTSLVQIGLPIEFWTPTVIAPGTQILRGSWDGAGILNAIYGANLSGASSPMLLNSSAGTSGQVLTSAGAGNTPTWTTNGAVSTVSVVTANGISGTVANATTTPAITLALGAITPSSIVSSGAVSGSNLSGTNTGDITLAAIGSSANANGATLSSQVLNLQPASASFGGVLTTGAQPIAGDKNFRGNTYMGGTGTTTESLGVDKSIMVHGAAVGTTNDTGVNIQYASGIGYVLAVDWGVAFQPIQVGGSTITFVTGTSSLTTRGSFDNSGVFNAVYGVNLSGTTSPMKLNTSAGTSGQVLTSAGATGTPTWTTPLAEPPNCIGNQLLQYTHAGGWACRCSGSTVVDGGSC